MTVETQKETLGFQTEVKQLLHLMIHSLYSNKEIFLRELISNASDAEDKLRFAALKDDGLYEGDPELKIRLDFDEEANTVTLTDNGIGMTRDDVIQNLGRWMCLPAAPVLRQKRACIGSPRATVSFPLSKSIGKTVVPRLCCT